MTQGPLRIAMLCVHSCPIGRLGEKDTGGMSVHVRELARELGKQGHTVDIYTRAHDPADSQVIELSHNTRLIHIRAGDHGKMHKLMMYPHLGDFACGLESFRKHRGLHYDIVHSHYWLSGWVGGRVQQWWDIPHVTTFHTLGAVKNAVALDNDEPQLRIETEREVAMDCHRVIATSKKEEAELMHHYQVPEEHIRIVPCGVNLDLFRLADREAARRHLRLDGESIILFVGRIDPLKGIELLLTAMTHLQHRQKSRLLVVGGDDSSHPELQRLRGLCRSLNIQERVTFLGCVEQEELPHFYAAADVCVMPSLYESFGLVPLESLACGTPVVTARVGAVEDIVRDGETGYIVSDNDPILLAERISLVLSNVEKHAARKGSTRESIAKFDWGNVAGLLKQEYVSAIEDYADSH